MGCVQSYFRKGSYDVYEAHNAGLSPSSTQSEKAALADGGIGEKVAEKLEGDDLEKDLVIVDADEIKLAEKGDGQDERQTSADANGSSTTGIGVAATAAAVGAAGAAAAVAAEALTGGQEEGSRPGSGVVEEKIESRVASALSSAPSVTAQAEDAVTSRPQSGVEPTPASDEQPAVTSSRPTSASAEAEGETSEPTVQEEEQAEVVKSEEQEESREAEVAEQEGSRPASEMVQEEEIRPVSATVSEAEAPSEPESSTRPESTVESASPAVNPETGTPLITFSRPLSSEGTIKEASRPASVTDTNAEKPADAEEVTIEGRVEESETKEADSSQPSELITEQPPSTVIDAEELGVKPEPDETAPVPSAPEESQEVNESSRPASGLPSEREAASPAELSEESKEGVTDSTAPVEDVPQPSESRPASGTQSNERPDSAISMGDSALESTGRSEALSMPAESPRPESANETVSPAEPEIPPAVEPVLDAEAREEVVVESTPSVENVPAVQEDIPPPEGDVSEAEPQIEAAVESVPVVPEDVSTVGEASSENPPPEVTVTSPVEDAVESAPVADDVQIVEEAVGEISPPAEIATDAAAETTPAVADVPVTEDSASEIPPPADSTPEVAPQEETVSESTPASGDIQPAESQEESVSESTAVTTDIPVGDTEEGAASEDNIAKVETEPAVEEVPQTEEGTSESAPNTQEISTAETQEALAPEGALTEEARVEASPASGDIPQADSQPEQPASDSVEAGDAVPPQEDESVLNNAASTIQAGFRDFQTRQALKQQTEGENEEQLPEPPAEGDSSEQGTDSSLDSAATKIQANFRGYMTRKTLQDHTTNEADIDDLPPPPSDMDSEAQMNADIDSEQQMNAAATTIQANFRGHQARQALRKEGEESNNETAEEDLPPPPPEDDQQLNSAATTIQANFRGFQTRQALRKRAEGANDDSAEDELPPPPPPEENEGNEPVVDSLLDSAATKIQATFRGHQVRKNMREANEDNTDVDTGESTAGDSPQVEIPEIDETTAATKIQAGFRGYQTRKNLRNGTETSDADAAPTDTSAEENAAELDAAATTIQANFRGFQARKAMGKEDEAEDETNESSGAAQTEEEPVLAETTEDPALNSAATTIQANFRGYQARKTLRTEEETTEDGEEQTPVPDAEVSAPADTTEQSDLDAAATRIQANVRGFQARQALQKDREEEDRENETGESAAEDAIVVESAADLNEAATKIQANFRGFQTRQLLKRQNDGGLVHAVPAIAIDSPVSENGSDPASVEAMNAAATKIQANFRGFQTRQTLKQLNDEDISESIAAGSPDTETIEDTDLNNAATVIQANFRGFQTRQALKNQTEGEVPQEPAPAEETTSAVEPETDLALHAAATTIQANFRGFQTRKNLQSSANQEEGAAGESLETLSGSALAAEESETSLTEVTGDASVITESSEREIISPPAETPRSPETGEKFKQASNKTSVDEDESTAGKPQEEEEVDDQELPPPPTVGASDSSSLDLDSSLSSAATKIQAGVRGYIARKQVQGMRSSTASTTAPSLPDSQQSAGPSVSLDDDGVQPAKSPETEVQNQPNNTTDDAETVPLTATLQTADAVSESATVQDGKGHSLDSKLDAAEQPKQELRSAISEPTPKVGNDEEDLLVWQTLQSELEAAATKIQSNFRGYRTRQRLQREDAVQMPTTSSSTVSSPPPPQPAVESMPNSGEFHDMMVLPPPTPPQQQSSSEEKTS